MFSHLISSELNTTVFDFFPLRTLYEDFSQWLKLLELLLLMNVFCRVFFGKKFS